MDYMSHLCKGVNNYAICNWCISYDLNMYGLSYMDCICTCIVNHVQSHLSVFHVLCIAFICMHVLWLIFGSSLPCVMECMHALSQVYIKKLISAAADSTSTVITIKKLVSYVLIYLEFQQNSCRYGYFWSQLCCRFVG